MLKLKARNFIFRHARQSAWRVGRWLHSLARGQTVNDMAVNGEARLQQMVVDAAQTDGRGITVCDVGANLGEWSDMMLQTAAVRGLDIRLFAFEPIPMTADRFAARFEGRPQAPLLWRMALSDNDGKGEMAVFSETGGTNSLVFGDDEDPPPTITVPLQTFDTWSAAQSVEAIDLMKIDAEGHDLAVLRGCTGMLRSGKLKVIQFEYNQRWITARAFLRDAFNLAQSFGYRVGQVCPEGIEIYNQWHFELENFFETNYVLVHKDRLGGLIYWRGDFNASNVYVACS